MNIFILFLSFFNKFYNFLSPFFNIFLSKSNIFDDFDHHQMVVFWPPFSAISSNMWKTNFALGGIRTHRGSNVVSIGVAPIGARGPPPVLFLWKRRYFSLRLASLNRNCVQYFNTTSVLVLYSVHYKNCNVRVSLQIQYVQMFLLSLYVRYTYCTIYAVISMYTYNRIFVL